MSSSNVLVLPFAYLRWHYTTAWGDLWRLYANLNWFLLNFFSLRLLATTLLSPWKRLHESWRGAGGVLGALILNVISRMVGVFFRLATIGMGCAALALLAVFFLAVCLLWVVMPVLPFIFIASGFAGLVSL